MDQISNELSHQGSDPHTTPVAQEILIPLSDRIPEGFRESATLTARIIQNLDTNGAEALKDPDTRRFVSELRNTGYIGLVDLELENKRHFAIHSGRPTEGILAKEYVLPFWLQRQFLQENGIVVASPAYTPDDLESEVSRWTNGLNLKEVPGNGGPEYIFQDSEGVHPFRTFKCYTHGGWAQEGLRNGQVQKFAEECLKRKISLERMKFYENSYLVWYFSNIDDATETIQLANACEVRMRGPAQDIFQIVPSKDGYTTQFFGSNDSTLGKDNGIKYPIDKRYAGKQFLHNYFNMCLYAGKKPHNPYKTGFVYMIGKPHKAEDIDLYAKKTGYPVVAVDSRHDLLSS